jgi:hypothetical protein
LPDSKEENKAVETISYNVTGALQAFGAAAGESGSEK